MNDNIPYVPNLTSAPSSPTVGSCYYNLTTDKYYVYNGSQWIEPLLEDEDAFILSYKENGASEYTVENIQGYDNLITALNRSITPEDVKIEIANPECVRSVSTGNNKEDWALLKLNIGGVLVSVGRIAPKIVFTTTNQGTTLTKVLNFVFSNDELMTDVYVNNVLVHTDTFIGYTIIYIDENDNTNSIQYTNYEDLITFLQTTNIVFKKVYISEKRG